MARRVFCEALSLELNLPDKCERIVSLSPAATESLFSMGLGEKIVAVSAYCVRPEEARKKPIIGSYGSLNLDRLRSLKPDLILTTTGYQRSLAIKLSKDFPVYALILPPSLASLISFCSEACLVAGYYEEAKKLEHDLLRRLSSIGKSKKKMKVYVEIDFGMPVSFGAYSYITDAISYLGHESVFEKEPKEWLEPKMDSVKEYDPDAIIYEPKMFRDISKEELLRIFENRNWNEIKAVKEGKIFITPRPYDFLAHHGPSFINEVLPWLKNVLDSDHN